MEFLVHCAVGFSLRVALLVGGCWWDAAGVGPRYTDVDYRVFSDAAAHLAKGESPFRRPTYRYTPLLAVLLLPNVFLHPAFGKLLFCACDVAAAALMRRRPHQLLWLYNPLPAVLCSRGSSESLVALLVLACVRLHSSSPALAGLVYGLAVHFKIYPCIYAPALYFQLEEGGGSDSKEEGGVWRLLRPTRARALFVACAGAGFAAPTLASLFFCGGPYLREAFLYHVTRRDVRHNFSPFFYPLYLLEAAPPALFSPLLGYGGFILQAVLVLACSVRVRPLAASLFLQTFVFVSLNKVCTSQYFAWYLCLLPLAPSLPQGAWLLGAAWGAGQGAWLAAAHRLEFRGEGGAFPLVFVAGLAFFAANAALAALYAKSVKQKQTIKAD